MRFEAVAAGLSELEYQPFTSPAVGRLLYELVLCDGIEDVLELGFAHGTSTAYIAAALDEKRSGCVTTVDRGDAMEREPNLHQVLRHLGLERWVRPVLATQSYNWELMRVLDRQTAGTETTPCLDFCFLDGAHTWETDALAFLLVDRLLRPNRWMVLDDIGWSFASSPSLRDSERVQRMPQEERDTKQIRKVIDLLVRPSGDYEVRFLGNLALAFKRDDGGSNSHCADFDHLLSSRVVHDLAIGHRHSARREVAKR